MPAEQETADIIHNINVAARLALGGMALSEIRADPDNEGKCVPCLSAYWEAPPLSLRQTR